VPAAQRGSAFVRRCSRDLDLIFTLQFERTVNRDNTVSIQNLRLQIEPVRWRATLSKNRHGSAGCGGRNEKAVRNRIRTQKAIRGSGRRAFSPRAEQSAPVAGCCLKISDSCHK